MLQKEDGNIITRLDDYTNVKEMKDFFLQSVEDITPDEIKKNPLIDISNTGKIQFRLTKDIIEKHKLDEWLEQYKKEAKVSTAGIRGVQNVLYPWDTRFPIHQIGIALATVAKALVLKEKITNRQIEKVAACEVRYNSKQYVEMIARIQAAVGIKTHLVKDNKLATIWMVSFLIFTNDYDGGEYVTSSHSISRKIATKDLNSEGSQFLPEESLEFVEKIEKIIKYAKEHDEGFVIELSEKNHPLIIFDLDGCEEYVSYLRNDIANEETINTIKSAISRKFKIMVDCLGGSIGETSKKIFKKLEIIDAFDFCNVEEDPFFHGVGKIWNTNKNQKKELIDLSCDVGIREVAENLGYEKILLDKPSGYVILLIDPDADRLITFQVEPKSNIEKLRRLGIDFIKINDEKICATYTPDQSFLFNMDYYMKTLRRVDLWNKHPRFIIKTTASAVYWNFWAKKNNIKVIETPVGFKELASIMKKVERQLKENQNNGVVVTDIFGKKIYLGIDPRVVFAGEESGGMITGPNDFIKSKNGRVAIAMREKSAGEASVLETSLCAELYNENRYLSDYFEEIICEDCITENYDVRDDIILYNENEPDPEILKKEKKQGEELRDRIDSFFLSICFAIEDKIITLNQAQEILKDTFASLNFSDIISIRFCGDGTYIEFEAKTLEVRKSGTDAKLRIYANGENKEELYLIVDEIAKFKGERNNTFQKYISKSYADNVVESAIRKYTKYEENI